MGIKDSAAAGLMSRLESVGVPGVIGYVIGQCAYIAERKRHGSIPTPIVQKSEITWLVAQYEGHLRETYDPLAKAALIQGLCVRVFGREGEGIFLAGYPELSPQAMAAGSTSQVEPADEGEVDGETLIFHSAARYIGYAFNDRQRMAQIPCLFPVEHGALGGFCIVLGGTVGFYDRNDLAFQDVNDGTPIIKQLSGLTGCTVAGPRAADLAGFRFILVLPGEDEEIFIRLEFGEDSFFVAVPFHKLEPEIQEGISAEVGLALGIFDRQLASNYAQA